MEDDFNTKRSAAQLELLDFCVRAPLCSPAQPNSSLLSSPLCSLLSAFSHLREASVRRVFLVPLSQC